MGTIFNLINIIIFKTIIKFGSNSMKVYTARKFGVKIGDKCRIYNCNFGSEPYLISIGNNCEITHGVTFITHDGATWIFRKDKNFLGTKYGPIMIKDNCIIGINSIILPNIEIGPNSVVGAGSVVTKNIPQNTVYAGNPARFICSYDQYLEKCYSKNTGNIPSKSKKKILKETFKDKLN